MATTLRRARLVEHFIRNLDLSSPAAMRAALDDLESTITRMAQRARWAGAAWRRTAVAPPAQHCTTAAPAPAPRGADSS